MNEQTQTNPLVTLPLRERGDFREGVGHPARSARPEVSSCSGTQTSTCRPQPRARMQALPVPQRPKLPRPRVAAAAVRRRAGRWHLPSFQSLGRVLDSLQNASPTSKTLGGCRVIIAAEEVMICRERRNLPHEIVLENDMSFVWDHRIAVRVGSVPDGQWQLKPGGTQPWSDEARQGDVYQCWRKLPASVRDSMPVVSGPLGVFSAPLLA